MTNDFESFLEDFVGGVPPFLRLEIEFDSLFYLVESHKNDRFFPKRNPAIAVSLIGLVAHFEAFCKHQFAAIANICPKLLISFSGKRKQTSVRLADVALLHGSFGQRVGFVVAEQYDFGDPENVNALFFRPFEYHANVRR